MQYMAASTQFNLLSQQIIIYVCDLLYVICSPWQLVGSNPESCNHYPIDQQQINCSICATSEIVTLRKF